jgi:hypothetical protein
MLLHKFSYNSTTSEKLGFIVKMSILFKFVILLTMKIQKRFNYSKEDWD